jgi:hypothetical protein
MPLPGPRGGLSIVTDPAHFPANTNSLVKRTMTEIRLKDTGLVGADLVGDPICVGSTEGFTVYAKGTGNWNIEVGPSLNSSVWINHEASDKSGNGFISVSEWHNFVRFVAKTGSNLEIWMYLKYAPY